MYSYDYVKSIIKDLSSVFEYEEEHSDKIAQKALELYGLYQALYSWMKEDDILIPSLAASIIIVEEVPMYLLENDKDWFNASLIKDMVEYCGKKHLIGTKVKTVKERPCPVRCPKVI